MVLAGLASLAICFRIIFCSRVILVVSKCLLLQLVLSVAMSGMSMQSASSNSLLPSATSVVSLADSHDRAAFALVTKMKDEPMDVESVDTSKGNKYLHFYQLYMICTSQQISRQIQVQVIDQKGLIEQKGCTLQYNYCAQMETFNIFRQWMVNPCLTVQR